MQENRMVIEAFRQEFASLRQLADRAVSQLAERDLFSPLGEDGNSIAVLMKHVGGNLRSRWTDVLTTDGEKPDRNRDGEFEINAGDTRANVAGLWARGFETVERALGGLEDAHLAQTVTVRSEPMPLVRALTRSLAHTAGHVHQIVLLARHCRGHEWQTLSIPRGRSRDMITPQRP